jgi:SAM-dependent methyltransferase
MQPPEVDFGKAADDYATHRLGFPPDFFNRLKVFEVGLAGQSILDIGTGTGLFALPFSRVGCTVTGLDPSLPLLDKARSAADSEGLSATFVEGHAEELPFDEASFDVVTAATCWHWFDAAPAAEEAARVLKPGGKLAIAAMDWHASPKSVVSRTLAILHSFGGGIPPGRVTTFHYPKATAELVAAGFTAWELFGFTTNLPYSHEAWRGRVRASQGAGPRMDAATLKQFDDSLSKMLTKEFPEEPLAVGHRLFALVAQKTI